MDTLDWIIVTVIGIGSMSGFVKGAIRQVASIVGLFVGLLVARALFVAVGDRMGEALGTSVTLARILAFALIGILVPVGFLLVASLLTRIVNGLQLGCINRFLGAGLGGVKYMLLLGILFRFIEFADTENCLIALAVKQRSLLYYPVEETSGFFYPAIRDVTEQLID